MQIPLRLTHTGDVGTVKIQVVRSDVNSGGEPHALESEQLLQPGDSITLRLRARSMIVITEESLAAKASLASAA
jgi:hypothetical protein